MWKSDTLLDWVRAKADETYRIFVHAFFNHCVKKSFLASKFFVFLQFSLCAELHSLCVFFYLINLCKINCTNSLFHCVLARFCYVKFFTSHSSPTIVKLFISLRSSSFILFFTTLCLKKKLSRDFNTHGKNAVWSSARVKFWEEISGF